MSFVFIELQCHPKLLLLITNRKDLCNAFYTVSIVAKIIITFRRRRRRKR
jgi:hypothetical protein